jgi:transcriptional regulator with XRE-family HTH domain
LGSGIQQERQRRGWQLKELAAKAGMAPATVHRIEAGEPSSLLGYLRLGDALDLEPNLTLRRERPSAARDVDPVHAAMGEVEATQLRPLCDEVRLDEPYQHYAALDLPRGMPRSTRPVCGMVVW